MDYFNATQEPEEDKDEEKKKMLYDYLQSKTSPSPYQDKINQLQEKVDKSRQTYNAGTLLASLSSAASRLGSIGGKEAKSDIIPQINEATYADVQSGLSDLKNLREVESRKQDLALRQSEREEDRKLRQEDIAARRDLQKQMFDYKKETNILPGQRAYDVEFGQEEAAPYDAAGGYAVVTQGLAKLKRAEDILRSGRNVSGPWVNAATAIPVVGETIEATFNEQSRAVRDAVQSVVESNLRPILGAQFTKEEGERILNRTYNPRLSEQENLIRLEALKEQMIESAKAKEAAIKYFRENNGTLQGFPGNLPTTDSIIEGIEAKVARQNAPWRPGSSDKENKPKKQSPNEVVRTFKGRKAVFDANTKQFLRYED